MALFVAEEGRHAALLGHALRALGVERGRLARRMAAATHHVDRRVRGEAAPWFTPEAPSSSSPELRTRQFRPAM